jgi:HPr kinase/phosphorylase
MQCHGALLEIRGVGVLLLGPSGVGKSECALELIRRGHRLVADDVVELVETESGGLRGSSSPQIRHYLEIRGLGILYVPDLFGERAVLESMGVDLICHLDPPDRGREYERVGFERKLTELAGVEIPSVTLPARPAGSIATVVEVAARDHLLRRTGRNAARDLDAALREKMEMEQA